MGKNTLCRWMFDSRYLSWMYGADTLASLPPLYRWFALYCARRSHVDGHVRYAEALFFLVSRLTARLRLESALTVNIDGYIVALDLCDPRMIKVPDDIRSDSSPAHLAEQFLSAGDTFVDIGANYGPFSVVAQRKVGADGFVVAIEPQTRLHPFIERTLSAGGVDNWELHGFACGDAERSGTFYIPSVTSGQAGLFERFSGIGKHRECQVQIRPLDTALDWRRFPGRLMVKIDVEGSELMTLLGAKEMILARRPALLIELNPEAMASAGHTVTDLQICLTAYGYSRFADTSAPSRWTPISGLCATSAHDVILLQDAK